MTSIIERAQQEAKREYVPGLTLTAWERVAYIKGATFAATITPEQVEAAARGMYLADRKDTLPEGFPERQWDNEPGLGTIRDDYVRRATAAFIAAGFQIEGDQ